MPLDIILAATLIRAALDSGNLIKLANEFWAKFNRSPNEKEFAEIEAEAARNIKNQVVNQDASSLSLSDEMAPVINEQMATIRKRIADTYRDPAMSSFDKRQQLDRIQRDYCFYMSEFRRFNAATLPPALEAEWESNSCAKFAF